jgi:hypothetical protein
MKRWVQINGVSVGWRLRANSIRRLVNSVPKLPIPQNLSQNFLIFDVEEDRKEGVQKSKGKAKVSRKSERNVIWGGGILLAETHLHNIYRFSCYHKENNPSPLQTLAG